MTISGSSGFNPAAMAKEFFKKADANGDGSIDKSELTTVLANGPNKGSQKADDVNKIFASVDTDGNGKIDETENANQLRKIGEEMKQRSAQGSGAQGAPPPGGGGGGGGGAAASSGSSSSDTKVYDPRDTNKDGTVSSQEEAVYSAKHPDATASQKSESTDKVKSAVNAMMNSLQANTKYNSQGGLTASSSGVQSLFSLTA